MPEEPFDEELRIYNRLYNTVMESFIPSLQRMRDKKGDHVLVMGDIVEPLIRAVAKELALIKEERRNG